MGFDSSQGLILRRIQQGVSNATVTVLDGANVSAGSGMSITNLGSGDTGTGQIVFSVDLSTYAITSNQLLTLTNSSTCIDASGHIVSGKGSGGVALTINDGYGNANVTFNHLGGVPEQTGNALRIETNTDGTSNPTFEAEGKTISSTVAQSLTTMMTLNENDGLTVSSNGEESTVVRSCLMMVMLPLTIMKKELGHLVIQQLVLQGLLMTKEMVVM